MKIRTFIFLFLSILTKYSNAQIISTIAGNGSIGDGLPAISASFKSVWNVGTDAAGNVYVADANNNRVRKIAAVTGIITTIAGNGLSGFKGDNGLATASSLSTPVDVFIAPSGNIYVSDLGNYRIRKITASTGIITTVAGIGVSGYSGDGGLATSAAISPWRLCVDGDENIYYTDNEYWVIRKIDGVTGIITTIAGTGTEGDYGTSGDGGLATFANIYYKCGICIDNLKNIYISDLGINRVRKIDAATGIITTVAGNGTTFKDGVLATQTRLSSIRSVSLDAAHNIYIGSTYNCRKIDAVTRIINTVVGTLSTLTGFVGDGGPATEAKTFASGGEFVDAQGNIYVADHGNFRVRKVPLATGIINTIGGNGSTGVYNGDNIMATNASLNNPVNICTDNVSNIYIADAGNNRVRKIDASTGIISTFAGNGIAGNSGDGTVATTASITVAKVRTDLSGNIYFSGFDGMIRKINNSTGIITIVAGNGDPNFTGDGGPAITAGIRISDFCLDELGNIYIADRDNYRIRKIDAATGIITTIAGTGVYALNNYTGDGGLATSATFGNPVSICADNQHNIYVGDTRFYVVRAINTLTGIISTFAGNGISNSPLGDGGLATAANVSSATTLFADNFGNIFIQQAFGSIRKVDKSTNIITTVAGNPIASVLGDGGLATDAGISLGSFTLDNSGTNLLIADAGNNRIRKVEFGVTLLCPASDNKILSSNITGLNYHWQMDNGTGFSSIDDNTNFSGTGNAQLHLINIPSSWSGYKFRCLVEGNYSSIFTLKFVDQWTGAANTDWDNIANWSCGALPDANTDVVISGSNTITITSNVTIRSLKISPGATLTVAPGSNLKILH